MPSSPSTLTADTPSSGLPLFPTGPSSRRDWVPGPAWPLTIWLLVQGATLLLATSRIPLSANYLKAGERAASDVMLAAQVFAAALLFPLILRDWRPTVAAVASTWPFLALAAIFSSLTPGQAGAAATYLGVWILGLALWRMALPRPKWQMVAAAVAGLYSGGGALLWYLSYENTPQGGVLPAADGRFGPVLAALHWTRPEPHPVADSLGLGLAVGTGIVAAIISLRLRSRSRQSADADAR